VVNLRCRTSDRTAGAERGATALAERIAEAAGTSMRPIGSPGEPRASGWSEDLREAHGCLLEAGGQVDDALAEGAFPVLTAADCSICITTLPTVARHRPDVRFAWLDAHGDFNTPSTTPSGYLGGMCLAAACGRWAIRPSGSTQDAPNGLEDLTRLTDRCGTIDPSSVVMAGVRDLDGGERAELELAGVGRARPSELPGALGGRPVYVHLDLDVLDPDLFPAQFPAPHGLSDTGLRTMLMELARSAEIVGLEVTAFEAPEDVTERELLTDLVTGIVSPLLPAGVR
jgi:arginase family enzyme